MDVMIDVLRKIRDYYPNNLLMIKNLGFWSPPGLKKYPINKEVIQIIHMCTNLLRLIFGKGYEVFTLDSGNFYLLKSLKKLELFEIDHIDVESHVFTMPTTKTCTDPNCRYCMDNKDTPTSILEEWSNLKSFRVRGITMRDRGEIIPDKGGPMFTNAMVSMIGNFMPNIKRLGLWISGSIMEREIRALEKSTELTELILSSVKSENFRQVFKMLATKKLKHLGLFYSENNNEKQNEDFRLLSEIPSLSSLHIGGWNLTNACFEHFINNYNLTNLSISRSQAITREGINFISMNKNITILRLSACIFLRDYDLIPLAKMKQLVRLDLDNTKSITDNFLKFLVNGEAQISELYLMGMPLITDCGVSLLSDYNPLKVLFIKSCQNVTEKSIQKIKECHISSWVGKLQCTLDNREIKQNQVASDVILPENIIELKKQIKAIEINIQNQLDHIAQEQPTQPEAEIRTAVNYQASLQLLFTLLHNQQILQRRYDLLLNQGKVDNIIN